MFRHILVPTDGSHVGLKAVREGIALAKALGAKATILTVARPFHVFSLDPELLAETATEHRRHEAVHEREDTALALEAAHAAGVEAAHVTAESDHLSEAVIRAAAANGCDLVVMATHDRTGLFGSSHVDNETVRLLARSDLPVLVLH